MNEAEKARQARYRAKRKGLTVQLPKDATAALERGKRQHEGNATAAVAYALAATYPKILAAKLPKGEGK